MKKLIITLLLVFICSVCHATPYFIDPVAGSDSDDGLSQANAWATFAKAMTVLGAGDTLYLMNGEFTGSNMLSITVSGTSGNHIVFQALNDGAVTVNTGSAVAEALYVNNNKNFIDITGIIFKRTGVPGSGQKRVGMLDTNKNVRIRRCSFVDTSASESEGYQLVHLYNSPATSLSEAVLIEDCFFEGRWGMLNTLGSSYCIIRRNFFYGKYAGVYAYHTNNAIIENNVGMVDSSYTGTTWASMCTNTNDTDAGDNNKFYGNVMMGNTSGTTLLIGGGTIVRTPFYQITGNTFLNHVSINVNTNGLQIEGDNSLTIQNVTVVWNNSDTSLTGINLNRFDSSTTNISATVKNCSLLGNGNGTGMNVENHANVTFTNTYNNYYNFSSQYGGKGSSGTGVTTIDPVYNTTTYGNGAYLMIPTALQGQGESGADMGAEVLYQYVDGTITETELWPWPMEDRIFAETGISVTHEANGGIWKTLDGVYAGTTSSIGKFTGTGNFR